jgi:DNA polymerase I-like protein with 3'-5' exonuclease and polymerase domains
MTVAIFDIESNGLYEEATKLHCVSIKIDDKPTQVFTSRPIEGSDGTLEEGHKILNEVDLVVGHNIINFDLPTMEKLGYPITTPCHDTLIMSRLAYPNIGFTDANRKTIPPKLKGSHSLKSWGYRLRKYKGDFGDNIEQWEKLTAEMVSYCRQDSEVTYALYKKLLDRNIPEEAIWLEQEFAKIISRQEKYGVYFDVKAAEKLHIELINEVDIAEAELMKTFTPLKTWFPKPYPKVPVKKDGTKSQVLLTQEAMGCHYNDKGEWGYYQDVVFNPSSRQHIARWLSEVYGWKPKECTEKGTPMINEKILNELDFPEGKVLAHYFNVVKLRGQLVDGKNAWMKMVSSDSRIRGRVNTLGAVSRRCTHSNPNMAQVPSGRAYKGHETRSLFCVPKGKKLVGCDADGLELRTLSHYMARYDNGQYAKAVDEGDKDNGTDIHTLNQQGAGLPTRDDAKTFIYAFLYGAGDAKIGSIINGTAEAGRTLKDKFFRQIPAIKRLVDAVGNAYKANGTLKALDGNPYHIRSSHSALNTLLQGAGALVMKYYLVFLDRNLSNKYAVGKQYEFVLNVHDEVQIECDTDIAEGVAKIAEDTFNDVTTYLKFRIPLRGSADIGDSWADTH